MGEIADDLTEGACCSDCGMYFDNPENPNVLYQHGYPVVCQECWQEYTAEERKEAKRAGLQVALVKLME